MTTYKVNINGADVDHAYKTKAAAIHAAKCFDCNLNNIRVVMHEKSGTYHSKTTVWPEVGITYTN